MKNTPNLYQIMCVNRAVYYRENGYLPAGYQLFFSSDELGLSKRGYYGISVINEQDKQIIICSAGTQIDTNKLKDTFHDVVSDIQIFSNKIPKQYKYALEFTEYSLERMPTKYNVTITGFSLGAVLADLTSFKVSAKYSGVNSITFENPGSLDLVLDHFKNEVLDLSTIFKAYNSAIPNLVNIFGSQIGESHMVCLDRTKFSYDIGKMGNALLASHMFKNFADSSFDDDHEIRLCDENAVVIEMIDTVVDWF